MEFLVSVAGGGPVLEVAIGTGRVALPLAARGHGGGRRCLGGDGAAAARQAGRRVVNVTVGDMADVPVSGPFAVA